LASHNAAVLGYLNMKIDYDAQLAGMQVGT